MKKFSLKGTLFFFFLIAICCNTARSQDSIVDKKSEVQNLVNNQRYTFVGQSANPASGTVRQLTSDYNLIISKKRVVCYLPYFGRSYSALINLSEGGIRFTSTSFDYTMEKRKKRRYEINIRLKDVQDPRQLRLTIFENGSASLQVTSINRQLISFNGYISKSSDKPTDQ